MMFNEKGELMPYVTARERLQQLNLEMARIASCTTLEEAHSIAAAMRRTDLRWRKGKKPSQIHICATEDIFRLMESFESLEGIHGLAKANYREPRPGKRSWDNDSMLSFSELQKAEKQMAAWKK